MYLEDKGKDLIENNSSFSNSTHRFSKNYPAESAILEKRLAFNSSLLSSNVIMCNLTVL